MRIVKDSLDWTVPAEQQAEQRKPESEQSPVTMSREREDADSTPSEARAYKPESAPPVIEVAVEPAASDSEPALASSPLEPDDEPTPPHGVQPAFADRTTPTDPMMPAPQIDEPPDDQPVPAEQSAAADEAQTPPDSSSGFQSVRKTVRLPPEPDAPVPMPDSLKQPPPAFRGPPSERKQAATVSLPQRKKRSVGADLPKVIIGGGKRDRQSKPGSDGE